VVAQPAAQVRHQVSAKILVSGAKSRPLAVLAIQSMKIFSPRVAEGYVFGSYDAERSGPRIELCARQDTRHVSDC
jgi:hypothetical protein